jgi:hypothetical protein
MRRAGEEVQGEAAMQTHWEPEGSDRAWKPVARYDPLAT